MRKNILKITIVAIMLIGLIQLSTFAINITMETKTNGKIYSVGGTVTATIEWTENMQATGFTLEYNSTKLSFTETSIGEDFYNVSEPILNSSTGDYYTNITVSWASLEEKNRSNITFTFTALEKGEANIAITKVECFADGNLQSPEEIDYTTKGSKTIQIRMFGDVNLDGIVDAKDRMTLNRYLDGQIEELDKEALENADVNLDGIVDEIDSDILTKYLSKDINNIPVMYGDVWIDGKIDSADVTIIQRYIEGIDGVELEKDALIRADVNLDGLVNDTDVLILRRFLVGYYDALPIRVITNSDLNVSTFEDRTAISGFGQEDMKVSDVIKNFNNDIGINVYNTDGEKLTSDDSIGTGTIVKIGEVENINGEISCIGEYTIVLYGDTTGDGKINAIDALALIKDINNKIAFSDEIYREAGRILTTSPEKPTAVDALAIIKHSNGKYKINQTK